MTNKDEALKLALDDLIAEYHMEQSSFAKRVDDIFKQALAAPTVQEPVAWIDCKVQMPPPGVRVFFLHKDYDRVGYDVWMGDGFKWTSSHWMPIPPLTAAPPEAQSAPVQSAERVEPVAWPAGLIDRIKAAEQRIQDGHAPRRIPADPTDVDLVLAEVRYLLEGKQPPFWIKTTPPAAQRQWVGLTDEEMMVAAFQAGFDVHEDYENEDDPDELHWWSEDGEQGDYTLHRLRDIIEAKLREKNG